jgi:hypothetical protein
MSELTASKILEMFTESIPGIIIQLFAIFQLIRSGGQVDYMAYTSLLVSILTTAFTSAQISYDFDTDPLSRAIKPGELNKGLKIISKI